MAVIAAKNIQLIVIHDGRMRVAGARASFRVDHFLDGPLVQVDGVPMEVVYTVEAVVAAEDEQGTVVHDGGVAVAG